MRRMRRTYRVRHVGQVASGAGGVFHMLLAVLAPLLAHEFEHILEQLDGVVLREEVASGRAWRTPNGAWETRRACTAGLRARQEVDELTAALSHADGVKAPGLRHPFD